MGTLKNFFSYSSLAGIAIYSIAAGNIKGPLAFKGILAILAINILLQILIYAKDVVQNPPRGKDDFLRFSAFSAAALNILFLILHSINPAILSPMIIIAGISICAILPFFNYISKNNKPKATGEDPAFEVGTVLALILLVTIPVVSLKTYMSLKGVPALIHIAAKQERSRHLTLEMYEDLRRSWAIEILKNKDRVNSAPHIVESLYRVDDDTGAVLSSMLDEINWKPHSLNEEILYLIGKESESSYTNGLPGIIAIGKEAVIPLLQILGKEDISKDCKLNVIRTLAGIGDKGATNCLVTLFTEVNEDRRVRCGAANALGAIKDASAVPSLIEALKEGDGEIRESSEKALVEIDDASAVTPLIEMLKDKNAEIRKVAAKILGKLGDQRAVGPLTDMLEKGDVWEVSYAAMGSLSELNVLPEALIVKTYIRDLRSKDSEYAARPTIEALGRMGSPAVPALTEELKNGKNVWREDVVKALGSIGDGRAIAPLIEVLRDDSNDLRKAAVEALSKFGESAIPLLVEALKNESATVRKHAAEVLDKLNWEPQTESEEKAYLLAKADLAMLLKAGDEQAIRFIEEALKDKNVSVRISIVCTLSSAGRPAVQYLVEKLKDENSGVREVAVRGLGEIGDPQTIQSLIDVLRDKESYVRVSAVKALGKIGDKRAMQPLSERLSDADSNVRLSAVKALARFPDAQVVSGLVKALSDKNQPVCEAAAESVKEMKAVPQLLGELTRAYDKNDRETINMIENALTVIDKPALLKWKQDRFSKHMPQLAEYIKWAGIGMILFVALGAIAWVLAKILRLKARASKDDSTHPFTAISAKRAAVISSALAGASVTAAASALFCNHDSMVWLAAASIFVAAGVFIALATVRYLFLSRATERELAAALIKRGFSPGQAKILSRYISITHSSINYSSINHWQPDIKAQYDNLKPEYILPDSEMRKALLPGNPAAREAYLTTLREAAFDAFQSLGAVKPKVRDILLKHEGYRNHAIGMLGIVPFIKQNFVFTAITFAASFIYAIFIENDMISLFLAQALDLVLMTNISMQLIIIGTALLSPEEDVEYTTSSAISSTIWSAIFLTLNIMNMAHLSLGVVIWGLILYKLFAWAINTSRNINAIDFGDRIIQFFIWLTPAIIFVVGARMLATKMDVMRQDTHTLVQKLERLVKTDSRDFDDQVLAVQVLQALMHRDRGEVIPELSRLSGEAEDERVRWNAIRALGQLKDERALGALKAALKDENPANRKEAVEALRRMGWAPSDDSERITYYEATEDYGELLKIDMPGLRYFTEVFKGSKANKKIGAANELVKIDHPEARELLLKALLDSDDNVSGGVLLILRNAKWEPANDPEKGSYYKGLVRNLRTADRDDRDYVKASLIKAGAPIVPDLIAALEDSYTYVRTAIADILGEIKDPRAIPCLVRLLEDSQDEVRLRAAKALQGMAWKPAAGSENIVYLSALKSWDNLVEIGKPAIPRLIDLLRDENPYIRESAVIALGKIGDPVALPPLLKVLEQEPLGSAQWNSDRRGNICDAVKEAIVKMGKQGEPLIVEALTSENYSIKSAAPEILAAIDPSAMALIAKNINDEAQSIRLSTIRGLGIIGSPEAVDLLAKALEDKDGYVKREALKAILSAKDKKRAAEILSKFLDDEDDDMRKAAAEALGEAEDAQAIQSLIGMMDDKDLRVREAAISSLRKIKPAPQLLEGLSLAYERSDREKIGRLESILNIVDPQALRDWKKERFEKELPAVQKIGLYTAMGLVASVVLGAIAYVLVKVFRLRRSGKTIGLLILALVLLSPLAFTQPTLAQAPPVASQNIDRSVTQNRDPDIKELTRRLKSNDENVRQAAKNALVKIGNPAVQALLKILKDDSWVREVTPEKCLVAEALGEIGDPNTAQALVEALLSWAPSYISDRQGMGQSVFYHYKVSDRKDKDAIIMLFIEHAGWTGSAGSYSSWALEVLGKLATRNLIQALSDTNQHTRQTAAARLKAINWKPASGQEEISYLIAREDWQELIKVKDENVILAIVRIIEKQGEHIHNFEGDKFKQIVTPATLKLLEEAYAKNDREKITVIENALTIVDKPALLKWKQERLKENLPAIQKVGIYTAIGLVAAVIVAGISIACVKLFKLKKSSSITLKSVLLAFVLLLPLSGASITQAQVTPAPSAPIAAEIDLRTQNKKIEELIKKLSDRDENVRKSAVDELVKIGKPAVKPLIGQVSSWILNAEARSSAAEALGAIGDLEAIEPLITALHSWLFDVRKASMKALVKIGPPATPSLLKALKDTDEDASGYAAEILVEIRDRHAVTSLVEMLKDRDEKLRKHAAYALGGIGDKEAAPALIEALKDKDPDVWKAAARALGQIREKRVVPYMLEVLKNKDHDKYYTREIAIIVLGEIGDNGAIQPLVEEIRNENKYISEAAAEALAKIGEPAVLPLSEVLKDKNDKARELAIKTLGKIGDKRAVPYLIMVVKDEGDYIQGCAMEALGEIGDPRAIEPIILALKYDGWDRWAIDLYGAKALSKIGQPAVPALIEALKDKNDDLRHVAAEALGNIGDRRAVSPLIEMLNCRGWLSRAAVEALGAIGDKQAIQPLVDLLGRDDRELSEAAANAIYKISDKQDVMLLIKVLRYINSFARTDVEKTLVKIGQPAVLPLIEVLKCDDRFVCQSAIEVLGKIGDRQAVKPIIPALKNTEWTIRQASAISLGQIGDKEAIPALTEALKDKEEHVRESAAEALGNIGGKEAIMALVDVSEDEDKDVRKAVAEAIIKINAPAELLRELEEAYSARDREKIKVIEKALNEVDKEALLGWKRGRVDQDLPAIQRVTMYTALGLVVSVILGAIAYVLAKVFRLRKANKIIPIFLIAIALGLLTSASGCRRPSQEEFIQEQIALLKTNYDDGPNHIFARQEDAAREKGLKNLVEIGEPAVPALVGELKRAGSYYVTEAVVEIGKPAVPELIKAFEESHDSAKNVANALCEIADPRTVQVLIKILKGNYGYNTSKDAAKALVKIGKSTVPLLLEALMDESSREGYNVEVLKVLIDIKDARSVSSLLKISASMSDWDKDVKGPVVEAIVAMGRSAVPVLTEALKDSDKNIRENAAGILSRLKFMPETESDKIAYAIARHDWGRLVEIGSPAIPLLIKALKDQDSDIRQYAAETLGKIGDKEALPALNEALKDEKDEVGVSIAIALGRIGDKRAVPALIKALFEWSGVNHDYRHYISEALGRIGQPGVSALIELMHDTDYWRRQRAAISLGEIGDKQNIPILVEALSDSADEVRSSAAEALGKIGDKRAVPALLKAFNNKRFAADRANFIARESMAEALGKIGDRKAVPDLLGALNDDSIYVRYRSAEALYVMGDHSGFPVLVEVLRGDTYGYDMRCEVVDFLCKIGDERIVRALVDLIETQKDSRLSEYMVNGLSEISNRQAIPVLAEVSKDKSKVALCNAAALAICKIGDKQVIQDLLDRMDEYARVYDMRVCQAIIRNMGKAGENKLVPYLLEHLDSTDVVETLGKIGDPRAVEPLFRRGGEDKARDRAIVKIGAGAVEFLAEVLVNKTGDYNEKDAYRAAMLLEKIPDIRAIDPLVGALNSSYYVQLSVVKALKAIAGSTEDVPALLKLLKANLPEPHAYTSSSDYSAEVDRMRSLAAAKLIAVAKKTTDELLLRQLLDADDPDIRNAARDCLKEMLNVPALLKELEGAYIRQDREKISAVEILLSEVDPQTLLDWKRERFEKELPTIRKVGVYAAIGLVVSAILGAVVYVLAKAFGLRKSNKTINLLIFALVLLSPLAFTQPTFAQAPQQQPQAVTQDAPQEEINKLVGALKDDVWIVRYEAAKALRELRWVPKSEEEEILYLIAYGGFDVKLKNAVKIGKPAAPALIGVLKLNFEGDIRAKVAEALGEIRDPLAVPALIESLKDEFWLVRCRAAAALGKICDSRALYPLIEKLHDESRHVREHATEALGMIGLPEAVEPLAGELNDEDQEIRNAAALALGMIGTPEVVPPLMEALRGRDTSIHSSAARALGYCHDPRATPLLIAKLDDGARYTYQSVVEALGEIGSPEAIPPLIKLLDDWEYANNASGALIKIGQPAVPAVVNLLKDKDRGIRRRAVHILEEIADPGTISVLIKAAGEDIGMRSDILKIVDSIKATNKTKVPKLLGELDKAYADNNREKIIGLETVLAEVDSRALLDWKKARLEKELPTIRKVGVYAAIGLAASAILGAIVYVLAKVFRLRRSNKTINFIILALMLLAPVGCSAKQQVEVPLTAAQVTQQVVPETQEKEIRKVIDRVKLGSSLADYAVKDLAEIGSPAITVLIRVLKDNDKLTRRAAAYALGKLDVKISAPYLIEALKDKDTYVQHSAIKALAEIDDRQAVQPLIDILLNGDDSFCRASAAEALGKLGDRSAIPALTQAVKFGNSWVCEHASAALGKIGGSEAVRPLIEILNNERLSIYLLESVIKSLGEIHDSQATPVLAQVLSNDAVGGDSNFELHELAIKSLGSIGDKGALQILTEALRNRWHADSAAAALGRVGDPQAVQPLIEALMDKENWVLRKRAAFALGELRDVRATIPLSGLLNDENYEVRNAAIEALGQIGDPRATHELVKALKDSESRKTPNRIEEAISKIDIAPTLLRDLEEAHAVHDREKIFEIESVLLRFDPASLNKWKEGRIKDKLPEIARIAKYAGVVMVLFTILGGVIYAALKAARRHKNIASIVFIVAAASAAFYLGGAGSFAAGGESAGAVLAAIPFIGMPKDGTGVDAVIAEEMTKLHSAMAGDARKKVIGKDLREQYEFTRRDRRKWAQFINKYSDEFGVTKAFIKGAKYIYGDRMQNAEDEKIFLQHLKACNLQALAERDAREVDLEELLDNKRIEYFTQAFGNNPAVLYQFCVRTEDPAKQDIIKEVAGLLSGSDVTSQVKGIVTWAALPDDIAEFLVMHGLQFDDHRLIEAVVRVAGAKSFRQFQGQLLRFSRNGNESLAVSSLEALIEMGAADAAEEIFKDLSGRQSNRMLVARIRAVALLKHGKAAGQLVGAVKKFLGRSVSQEVRSAALDAITQLGCRDRAIDELNLMRPTLKPDGVSDLDDMIKMLKASPGMKVRPLPYAGDAQVSRLSNELVSMKRIIAKGFAAAMEENEEPYDDYSDRPDFFYRNGKSLQFIDTKTSINGRKEGKESVPDERSTRIVPILRTVQDLEKIAQAVELQDPLLLVGETGVGKTTLIRYLARLSKNNVRRFNLNGQTDKLEFIGGYKPEAYSITRDEAYDMAEVLLADESSEAVSALMNAVKKIAGQDMQYDAARKFIRRAFDGRHNTTIMALAEAVANKTFEFKWHYGVLVEAMRSGHWIILDEINLAEPEIIERIRYLLDAHPHLELSEYSGERWIDSRDYDEMVKKYVTKHGRAGSSEGGLIAEAVKDLTGRGIHRIDPNFRLFATMNPLEYEARKQLSPALMNKFRIKWIKELEPGDIAGILRARYDLGDDVISKLITLYVGLTNKEMSGNSGKLGRNEGISYYYTIRHLFRLAERIERRVKECAEGGVAPGMDTIIGKNAWEVYGDGLRSEEDRAIFKEMLDKVVSVPARQEEIKVGFDNTRKNILIGDVALPVNSAGGPLVPGPDSKLLPVGKTATLLEKIARSVLMDEKTLLVGPTGSAKTSLIRYLAHLTRNEFIRVNLDAQADTSDLIGKPVPKEGSKGEIVWEDGILLRAMEKGQWILLDEFNLAEPDILERINSILDDDGSLVVTENNNERWVPCHIYDRLAAEGRDMSGIRRIHENFRLFAAMNPERYAGRNKLSRAMMNKLAEKWVSGDMDDLSVKMIAKFYLTDSTLMEEPPVKESAQQIADIISGVYISVRSMLEKNELGRGKISGANAGEYNFSLRDLKALAKFVRGLSGALGANRAVIEGSLYIFRDRLEGIEDKGKFKDDVLGKIDQSVIGGAAVDIEKLDVLEEEGRSAAELITQPRVGAVAGPTPAQIQLAELVEKFDALTMGFPAELNSEEGLGAIRKMLLTAGREADGVRGFALLPADTAILLIDEALESEDP
ncbi:MAG: HEAT repeat domain-containing protein, partial [Candidatus Omnitrophica bacterium]|nr:HEAT repeat domain-containing protein [Candidatus Omnitrophota bacterium]